MTEQEAMDRMTHRAGMPAPADLDAMLDALSHGIQQTLGGTAVGLYLRGSLALGAFDPATSDVDFLVITQQPVTEAEFMALAGMHVELAQVPNPYARRLEGSYLDRASVRCFRPGQGQHPSIGVDWEFGRGTHESNWVLELWTVRERGVVLFGPDPRTLIDPIPPDRLLGAVRAELGLRSAEWAGGPAAPEWLLPRNYQAFAVETMCRALFTLAFSELPTKPQAVAWALGTLPEPWRTLVEQSQDWRADRTPDPASVMEVLQLVRWAALQAGGPPAPEHRIRSAPWCEIE